jgi:Peptidase family M28
MTSFLKPTVLAIVTLILLFSAIMVARQPPSLQSTGESDSTVFDGASAMTVFERVLPNNEPHPVGSFENRAMRDRIIAELAALGIEARIQSAFSCSSIYPSCSPVENIVAIHKGSAGNRKVLAFVGHYDSQMSGPGAADDMAAVAVLLELARWLTSSPAVANDVAFIFTDAEEKGLLGAEAFAQSDPLASRIGLMVNMEARGASGRATLFETHERNAALMSQLRPMLTHPTGTSLFHAIYKMLPNDTDYSVFRARDVPGINFAFTGSPSLYHSRLDDLEHLDKGSLQHHGQNALDILNGFGDADLSFEADEDVVFFDLFGDVFVTWPMSWSWGFLTVVVLAMGAACFTFVADGRIAPSGVALGGVIWAISGLAALAGGFLLSYPIGEWAIVDGIDHAQPWGARLSLLLFATLVALSAGKFLMPRVKALEISIAVWTIWFLLAFALQVILPGGIFLFLGPCLVFAATVLLIALRPQLSQIWCFLPSLLAVSYFGMSAAIDIETVINFDLAFGHMVPLVLMLSSLLIIVRFDDDVPRLVLPVAGLALVASVAIAFLSSSVTADRPAGMNVVQYQNMEIGEAFVLVEDGPFFPAGIPAFDKLEEAPEWVFPWGTARWGLTFRVQPDELSDTPKITVDSESSQMLTGRQVSLRISSSEDVASITLYVQAGPIRAVRAEGQPLVLGRRGAEPEEGSWVPLTINGLYGRDIEMTFDVEGSEPIEAYLSSQTSGLSGLAASIASARPAHTEQVHQGDHLLQVHRLQL